MVIDHLVLMTVDARRGEARCGWRVSTPSGPSSCRCEPMPSSTQTSWFSDYDLYLLGEGTHYHAYEKMGAHLAEVDGQSGIHFALWAPNAREVSAVGDFNGWNRCMQACGGGYAI